MPTLITEEYRKLNSELHKNPDFGRGGKEVADQFADAIKRNAWASVLDYGAGKQVLTTLLRELLPGVIIDAYDPAFPQIAEVPMDKYDFVICKDVIEHIEPECLDDVLGHIASLTKKHAYLLIATGPAIKTLPDGRNAHLIVQPTAWWTEKLVEWYDIEDAQDRKHHAEFIVSPRAS